MSDQPERRYPLSWPTGWKRTINGRKRAAFGRVKSSYVPSSTPGGQGYTRRDRGSLSIAEAVNRLDVELRRLGVREGDWLISSNVQTRLDGLPYANRAEPADPGVAVYFRLGQQRKPRVLACDKWDRVADNIAAIAGHIDAIRAQERYGVGTLDQAFAGYAALPENTARDWRQVFGFADGSFPTWPDVEDKFRAAARAAHPDAGGSHEQMARLTEAKAFARKELVG
jgi:hypothetical protein